MNTEVMNLRVYTEACVKMALTLTKVNIEFTFKGDKLFGGGYFLFPKFPKADLACHHGTYGADQGLFESYRFPWDEEDVTGWLSPEDFIEKYKEAVAE